MSYASKVKNKRLKSVTLETGDVIQVRGLQKVDFLMLGDVPLFLRSKEEAAKFDDSGKSDRYKAIAENSDYFKRFHDHIMTQCVVTPGFKVVVDKPVNECADDEFHVSLFSAEESAAIIAAAIEAGGMPSGAAAAARPFPAEPAAAGNS